MAYVLSPFKQGEVVTIIQILCRSIFEKWIISPGQDSKTGVSENLGGIAIPQEPIIINPVQIDLIFNPPFYPVVKSFFSAIRTYLQANIV